MTQGRIPISRRGSRSYFIFKFSAFVEKGLKVVSLFEEGAQGHISI